MNTGNNNTPEGYNTVCPYLMVKSIEKEIEFLINTFGATLKEALKNPDGSIMHGEVRIGDTVIMLGGGRTEFAPRESMNYVHVGNADEVFRIALENGATTVMELGDRFYGNREGGFKDQKGNTWWIAQQIEKMSPEEMQKRLTEIKS